MGTLIPCILALLVALGPGSRRIGDAFLRLLSCPLDPELGTIAEREVHDLAKSMVSHTPLLHGKRALVVGGTRGIGRGTAIVLAKAGASVSVVGRNTTTILSTLQEWGQNHKGVMEAFSADLSTVEGSEQLIKQLQRSKYGKFNFVFFTVGCWPDYTSSLTGDGIEKVVALDLLAHHVVLKGLYANNLLEPRARVMNTIASTQAFPFITKQMVIERLTGPPGALPFTLMSIAVAGDAWLHAAAKRMPELTFVGMFPGIVSTSVIGSTFPQWMVPILQSALWPVAISEERSGLSHVVVLCSSHVSFKSVSFFNHLLEGRKTHHLASDPHLSEQVYERLDQIHHERLEMLKSAAYQARIRRRGAHIPV